jgi:hypothetical protein
VFDVPKEADLFILIGLFPEHKIGKKVNSVPWKPICLVFDNKEMKQFMSSLKTKSGGKESKFILGFNSRKNVYLRRGNQDGEMVDYSSYLIENRVEKLKGMFMRTRT